MAPKKNGTPAKRAYERAESQPQYPYTPAPGSLRRFLQLVPTKPKPSKVNRALLRTWGFNSSNDLANARVLKQLGMLGPDNSTNEKYAAFMQKGTGPAALGERIRETYPKLFESFSDPRAAAVEELTNFFNINSGGSEKTIEAQVQTLKALADFASFEDPPDGTDTAGARAESGVQLAAGGHRVPAGGAAIHIDLHVHLPENKSKIEYDAIFESIAQHIMGKKA